MRLKLRQGGEARVRLFDASPPSRSLSFRREITRFRVTLTSCLAGVALLTSAETRAHAAEIYEGKTIRIVVGSDAGGGFDAFARLLARHLGRMLPGAPSVVVENMPGAGGATAAAYVYAVAPKDGTVIGAMNTGGLLGPLFEGRASAFDTAKFRFLGSANASARLCVSPKTSRIKSYETATRESVLVGASGVGSAAFDYAYLHKNVHRGDFNIVAGYKGMADILLAMDRGEVEMVCGLDWSSLQAQRSDADQFNLILKVAVQPNARLDAMNIPDARSFARDDTDRAIGDLVAAQQIFGRPYAVAPGVPTERLTILRAAFDAVMRNEQFIREASSAGLSIDPANGERVEATIRSMYAAPEETIAGARKAIRP